MTTRAAPHDCPANGCTAQVPFHQLACRADWYRLPKRLRDELNAAYHGEGQGTDRHTEALRACLDWYREN